MTGRSLDKLLEAEARRRPEIAAMLEIVEHLTDHDIDTAVVPLPWYRTALRVMRDKRRGFNLAQNFEEAQPVVRGFLPEMEGTQVFYRGREGWFDRGTHSGVSLLIPTDTHLFVTDHLTVWYNCTSLAIDDRFKTSQPIKRSTLTQYKADYNERMLKLHADAPVIISEQAATPAGRLASFGVNFF